MDPAVSRTGSAHPGGTAAASPSPVRLREIVALAVLVSICDITVYHGQGLAGWALLMVAAPVLLRWGTPRAHRGPSLALIGLMLAALAARMVWCGAVFQIPVGRALLAAFAMRLAGQRPYVLETVVFASQSIWAGYQGLGEHARFWSQHRPRWVPLRWLNIALPLVVAVLFSALFVLANPDLASVVSERLSQWLDAFANRLVRAAPEPQRVVFWLAVLWIGLGVLRPVVSAAGEVRRSPRCEKPSPAALYPAFRNMVVVVILLFAGYLIFEFQTLWFRVFPPGFHYSGYAHEGAAWLTIALALATIVLAAVFRGDVLGDPRLPLLKRLACSASRPSLPVFFWCWSRSRGSTISCGCSAGTCGRWP